MENVISAFVLQGKPVQCRKFGSGHINSTFYIATDAESEYVLQKINKYVFKRPEEVMANVVAVTEYLRSREGRRDSALHFIPTRDGRYYHIDEEGEYWRMYDFVPGYCLDLPKTDDDFYQSALAFGSFLEKLAEFPAETLYETIPDFHNTVDRYRQFHESIELNACGRLAGVEADVTFLLQQEELTSKLQNMRQEGLLPLRVTHNDTKLNNVLLSKETGKPLCVLDLDTVMPGLSAYDFADSIRFGAATAGEDEVDLDKMELDLHKFEVYTKGFLEAAPSLTDLEVEVLPLGALTLTLEQATRFLKDYLDGDLYFRAAYPEHNLVRARTQIKLASDMMTKFSQMQSITQRIAAQVR